MNTKLLMSLLTFSTIVVNANDMISKTLAFIEIEHQGKPVTIKRIFSPKSKVDAIVALQPMEIGNVKTIGELEVLNFIKESKDDARLMFIDARTKRWYHKETIASAMNLPFSMLDEHSTYQEKIVTLLGAVYFGQQWDFSNVNTLLIFGNGIVDIQATSAIKSLIKLGYPSEKLLYYRGGIESWKRLGLSVIN